MRQMTPEQLQQQYGLLQGSAIRGISGPMRTQTFNHNQNKEQKAIHMDTVMLVENSQSSASQRLMLVYADSSDEENEDDDF